MTSTLGHVSLLDRTLLVLTGEGRNTPLGCLTDFHYPLFFPGPSLPYTWGQPQCKGVTLCRGLSGAWVASSEVPAREQLIAALSHAVGGASRIFCQLSFTRCFSCCSLEAASMSLLISL